MYLFTRQGRLAPAHLQDGIEWAIAITEKVNQITSLDVGLWSPTLSPGVGRLSWGTMVESLGDLEDAEAKLLADPMYLELAARGAELTVGGIDDTTAQFVHRPADGAAQTTHVAVVQSQLANGGFRRGIEVGVRIAEMATEIGGLPTSFLLSSTGTYAGCAWLTNGPGLRELEAAEQAVNANPDFLTLIDEEAATCFLPGVTTQSIWRAVV
jgi:hypothetical protein